MRYGARYVLTHWICAAAQEGIYVELVAERQHIEFAEGKYIECAMRIYRVAQQHIDKREEH